MRQIVTCLILMGSPFAFSQQKTVFIKDSLTHEPIPFVTVQFSDTQGGIYADEYGKAIIPDSIQNIYISQIAYQSKALNLLTIEDKETITLTPADNPLPEIVVKNIPLKRKEIGYLKRKKRSSLIPAPNTEFALFIPYDSTWSSPPAIISIISFLDEVRGSKEFPSAKCNVCFDLRLPDEDGVPGDISILGNRIINNSTKYYSRKKEVVQLEQPVSFPEEGVFIVIDFITPNNPDLRLLISPSIAVTGAEKTVHTWSRTIANNFKWKKMDQDDSAWSDTINRFYGEDGIMSLRAGLLIAY